MLGENALGYVGGAGSCSGCGEATALRMLVAATRQIHGPESMGIVAATGCNTVYGSTYPYNPYVVPWTNSLFENAADRRDGHPRALGPGRPCRSSAVGHRWRRRDVRHRLPGAFAHGRQRRRHQGHGPRHAGLLEHRRPGIDGQLRRPDHQAIGVRAVAPRPPGAPQGARPDPDGPRRGVRRADDDRAHQPLLSRRDGRQRVSRAPRSSSSTRRASPSTASPTTRRRHRRDWRSTRAPSRCSPTTRAAANHWPSGFACRAIPRCATTGTARPTATCRLRRVRANGGPLRVRTSRPTARSAPRSRQRHSTASRTGGPCRRWPASVRSWWTVPVLMRRVANGPSITGHLTHHTDPP